LGGQSPQARAWGNRVSPRPARGGVWEGYALKQGDGETGLPHTSARGRVREGAALLRRPPPPSPSPSGGGWKGGNPVSPSLCGCGPEARAPGPRFPIPVRMRAGGPRTRAPFPHPCADAGRRPAHPGPGPWEGPGERRPPMNTLCASRRGAAEPHRLKWPYDAPACWPRKPGSLTPRYASSTRGWRCTSAGGPSAIRAP